MLAGWRAISERYRLGRTERTKKGIITETQRWKRESGSWGLDAGRVSENGERREEREFFYL